MQRFSVVNGLMLVVLGLSLAATAADTKDDCGRQGRDDKGTAAAMRRSFRYPACPPR